MKKTWFVLPGYCVGLGGLVLITYRTILAISSPDKAILVSVNRFGEQYLDLVALVFLWVVCLVGLLCLSSLAREMKRRDDSLSKGTQNGVVIRQSYSLGDSDSFLRQPRPTMVQDAFQGSYRTDETVLSLDNGYGCWSLSVVIPQEGSSG